MGPLAEDEETRLALAGDGDKKGKGVILKIKSWMPFDKGGLISSFAQGNEGTRGPSGHQVHTINGRPNDRLHVAGYDGLDQFKPA